MTSWIHGSIKQFFAIGHSVLAPEKCAQRAIYRSIPGPDIGGIFIIVEAISVISGCYLSQGDTIAMVVIILSAIALSTIQVRYMVKVGRNPRLKRCAEK